MMTSPDSTMTTDAKSRADKRPHKSLLSNIAFLAIVGFIVITTLFLVIKGKSPKGICSFDHAYRKATCGIKQLSSIPQDIPENALAIHMGNKYDKTENSLTLLERQNLSRFKSLQDLKLVKCGIRDIASDSFADLGSLRILDLRYNRISSVEESTFKGLTSLEYLYLSNNPLMHLSDYTFRGIRIENLILANNPALVQLSNKAFAGAILKTLVLNRCSLTEPPQDVFWHISASLQELHITNNLQTLVLPKDIFKGLRFNVLNLDNNGMSEEDFLSETIADEISLDDNPLGDLDIEESVNLKHTRRLSLSNTQQQMLSPEDFINLSHLEELDLEANQLTTFNVSDLTRMEHLKILDVSRNKILDVTGDFNNLPSLVSLYLDGNQLYTVPDELQDILTTLRNLTVHDNPLHCNCELKWFASWLKENRHVVQEAETITCETPTKTNFTQMSENDFVCKPPKILNATFDSDGISLVCTAEGDPAPTVTWTGNKDSDHSKVSAPVEYRKDILETTCVMPISRDRNFTCTASNAAGSDSVTFDTKNIGASGIRFTGRDNEIEILETQAGMWVTIILVILFGYLMRTSRGSDDSID